MKNKLGSLIRISVGLAMLFCVTMQAQGGVIYEQGDFFDPTSAQLRYDSLFQPNLYGHDDFTLDADATIKDLSWWVLAESTPDITTAFWEFRNIENGTTLGSIIAAGSAAPTSVDTGFNWSPRPEFNIYRIDLDIADTELMAGSYFFGLHTESTSVLQYWSYDSDRGVNLSPALLSTDGVQGSFLGDLYTGQDFTDLQFRLNGIEAASMGAVPEPASLAIFATIGLFACGRRRSS